MKGKLYSISPVFIQQLFISMFNFFAYRKRYGGNYKKYRKQFMSNRKLSRSQLEAIQNLKYSKFISHAKKNSKYFKSYDDLPLSEIMRFPIMNKEDLRKNIQDLYTVSKAEGIISKTGGTTGKSLEVRFTADNMQERFAMLDDFRNRFGYQLGKKTAWFSGKNLLTARDVSKNHFWKSDFLYKVRYYSTFHIKEAYLKFYIEDLIKFQPEYIVGFPSSILEIAKFGIKNNIKYPENVVKAVFPTAETLTEEMYQVIEGFFKTKMYNQYASSEGAPFIFECQNGGLHLELQSGVFEVLDENNQPTNSGRLVVTSFTTEGSPLIRYDIGDTITLEDANKTCNCGNNNPLVKEILGRIDDYIFSPENGKINLGNISNTLKDTKGIVKFQVIQDELDAIHIKVIIDKDEYSPQVESKFINNWRDRIGNQMNIKIEYVEEIPSEKSGKFRMVKNNIKSLIN